MTVLLKTGQLARRLFRGMIYRLWIQPLESHLIPQISVEKPNRVQSLLLRMSIWSANAGKVLLEDLRPNVTRWAGPDWSVTYIGNRFSAEALCHTLFPEPPETRGSTQAFLWQVPGLVRKFTKEGDLVVCELNHIIHLSPKDVDLSFTTPQWVKQVIEGVNRPLDEVKAKIHSALRRRACKLEAQGYYYVMTHSEADFDLFYHRMYLPYVATRHNCHGPIVRGYDYVHRSFEKGSLLMVKEGEEPVAGMVFEMTCNTCLGVVMGVMDGRLELVEQGTILALWWFLLTWANEKGVNCIEMGSSLPMTENGVFIHKRRWGAHVYRDKEVSTQWKFFGKNIPGKLRLHINKLGFIREINGQHFQVMLLEPGQNVSEAELAARVQAIEQYGLKGVLIISAGGAQKLYPAPASHSALGGLPTLVVKPIPDRPISMNTVR